MQREILRRGDTRSHWPPGISCPRDHLGRPYRYHYIKGQKRTDAYITEVAQPGYLPHECLVRCLLRSQLNEIEGISFPGAFGRETVGTVWKAWVACSIFGRTDVDLGGKIKLYREGAICIEAKALEKVLKFAFDKCTTWTEFICSRSGVRKHTPVESYEVTRMYDKALKSLKLDMVLAERSQRPMKEGPVGFLAPRCAAALERDGLQGGKLR
ncbi:hypothetical protein Aduo_008986 [Ancylostoma duodenale]